MKLKPFALSTILLITLPLSAQNKLQTTQWNGQFDIGKKKPVHFEFRVKQHNNQQFIEVTNGKEIVPMQAIRQEGDSLVARFEYFPTELKFKRITTDSISGRWINHLKKDYSIPFTAVTGVKERSYFNDNQKAIVNLSGKWKTKFYNETDDYFYEAIGIFKQQKQRITGTFLTETGDYRFLEGNVYGNQMILTAFDGSHVYQFEAQFDLETKQLEGTFRSGNHFHNHFTAERNENFELKESSTITYVQENKPLEFNILDTKGNKIHYSKDQYPNKVVLLQVMGTWCSNCTDETHFFKELKDKYGSKGLEILGIAFEIGQDTTAQLTHLKEYAQKFNLNYPLYLGGTANKKVAAELFNNIFNGIFSFPTSILIDKHGNIVHIHSGFNGPGTGAYYNSYVKSTKKLLKALLKAK